MKVKQFFSRAFKLLIFLLIAALLFAALNLILTPKWRGMWRSTDTITGFNKLEPDSIDTLFLGSSQVITGISPLQLYEEAGIRAYALGSERQPMLGSYYLLRDALRTQTKLKAVVVEATELFPQCNEPSYRKVFDFMYPSQVKWEGIQEHLRWAKRSEPRNEGDIAPTLSNYLFPVLSYHDRWKELNQDDFSYFLQDRKCLTRGFSIQSKTGARDPDFEPLAIDTDPTAAPLDPEAFHFFQSIVNLCKKRNIFLLVIKTTRSDWTLEQFNATHNLCISLDVPYIDFNTPHRLDAIGFDYDTDILKGSETHLNLNGARKVTAYLADYLTENAPLEDTRGAEDSAELERDLVPYHQLCADAELTQIKDWRSYLSRLYRRRYTLLVSVFQDDVLCPTEANSPELFLRTLKQLGLDPHVYGGGHYVAVLENGKLLTEQWNKKRAEQSITLPTGDFCSLSSDGVGTLNGVCTINVNKKNYSLTKIPGIQIAVYNHDTDEVVDVISLQSSKSEDSYIEVVRS